MSGLNSDSLVALAELRNLTQIFFNDEKITAKQIISIDTQTTSTRLLAFGYYGNSALGQNIATLNGEINVSGISGSVEIFTS